MTKDPLRKTAPKKSAARPAPRLWDAKPAANAGVSPQDAAIMAQSHQPQAFLMCCIDSRLQPAKILDYGAGIALEYRPIGCVIPAEDRASENLLARMAFRRLNKVSTMVLICHSDCGGMQAALKVPEPEKNGDDLHAVASAVHASGLDLAALGRDFLAAEEGDIRRAGDRLAREVGVQSLRNLMRYKGRDEYATVADEVAAGVLNVTLLYYDLEQRAFSIYDTAAKKWRAAASAETVFMKNLGQPHNCADHAHE